MRASRCADRAIGMERGWWRGAQVLALAAALTAMLPGVAAAQGHSSRDGETAPTARPEDVRSIDAIVAALYDVISGPAGAERDWDRFRSLFLPGARLIPTGAGSDSVYGATVLTVEEYIERAHDFLARNPFYEGELGRQTHRFGNIAELFSGYASRRAPGEAPFVRGVNSIQLVFDGTRWWVATILWAQERPGLTLPPELSGQGAKPAP
ncbi:MAG TPA: hypothetical protein VFK13_06215 [Gemmatimonadaceae bacterium]|nr:hypothetical protein [Gemmatimonadaceae bacterium]